MSVHMNRAQSPDNTKVHRSLRFTVHSRIVDPKYRTCFISACWRLEFGGGSLTVGKSVHPCLHAQALFGGGSLSVGKSVHPCLHAQSLFFLQTTLHGFHDLNFLNTNRTFNVRTQFVPRSKHSPPRL